MSKLFPPICLKPNLIAAGSSAIVTTALGAFTVAKGLGPWSYVALALFHLLCAYFLLELLWSPLTWFRELAVRPWMSLGVAAIIAIILAGALCLIFPYKLFADFVLSSLPHSVVEFIVIAIHLFAAFLFAWSLNNFWLFRGWLTGATPQPKMLRTAISRKQHRLEQRSMMAELPFRPRLLAGALSFLAGLYIVLLFEWWMVNLHLTIAKDESIRNLLGTQKVVTLAKFDPDNFLRLPKFLQPYRVIEPAEELKKPEEHPYKFRSHRIVERDANESQHSLRPVVMQSALRLAFMQQNVDKARPDTSTTRLSQKIQSWIGGILPVVSIMLSGTFVLFLGGIVPVRLMGSILPSVWHDSAACENRLRKTATYANEFYFAILSQNPLFSIASLLVWIFLIVAPLLVILGGKVELLQAMVGSDQILFAFTLLAAWVSPVIYAGVYVDRTFGAYFNTKLSNLILGLRGHTVILGYGDLGQRVVKRELLKMSRKNDEPETKSWQLDTKWPFIRFSPGLVQRPVGRHHWHEKVVSPDLNIEELCTHFIIVDRDSGNFAFAAANDFLGTYGVVAAWEAGRPNGLHSNARHAGQLLVPIVQGDATEPFTLSRVNLERASFLISTVSQEERIRDIFTRAVESRLRSIICISRSDQIVNLTYRATAQPITFIYPKQHSGIAFGQRLLAAVLKVRPTLPANQSHPRIIVIGLNKSNHFMLETLWHNWPQEDDGNKGQVFAGMLRFVITGDASVYTVANERDGNSQFSRSWRSSFITGFRHFQKVERQELSFSVPTCVMQADESSVMERCFREFPPDIVVINDDNAEKCRMLLIRAINSLERLKFEQPQFRLPLILMSAAGGESEHKDVGDAFRLYESLTRLYHDDRGPGDPRHAHFRRTPPRRLVGDSLHDALADTEEIISAIRDNWEQACTRPSGNRDAENHDTARDNWGEAFEVNTCLPNVSDSLARLAARLAGLEFQLVPASELNGFFADGKASQFRPAILRPSFQYVRFIKLEVPGYGFCFTGYADLQEENIEELSQARFTENEAIAERAYAKDDLDYIDNKEADAGSEDYPVPKLLNLTTGPASRPLHAQPFVETMSGEQAGANGRETFCPGMNICSIASYQHYIVASNGQALKDWRNHPAPLANAPNYGCAKTRWHERLRHRDMNATPKYARIFCCCHGRRNDPGHIAIALNLLLFQKFSDLFRRGEREVNAEKDWVVNVEYFKHVACQNRRYSLNRMFGVRRFTRDLLAENKWSMEDYVKRMREILPISLLQILPVGAATDARQWFEYAVALWRFLNQLHEREFYFQWWDQNGVMQKRAELNDDQKEYPIAIQINNHDESQRAHLREAGLCEFCKIEDPDMAISCAQSRPWMEEEF